MTSIVTYPMPRKVRLKSAALNFGHWYMFGMGCVMGWMVGQMFR